MAPLESIQTYRKTSCSEYICMRRKGHQIAQLTRQITLEFSTNKKIEKNTKTLSAGPVKTPGVIHEGLVIEGDESATK